MLKQAQIKINLFLQRKSTIFAIFLLLIMLSLEIGSSLQESQTVDEGVHLVAGWSYLKNLEIKVNPEHPPLIKMLQAIPLIALRPKLPSGDEQWSLARQFLYTSGNPTQVMLFAGRFVTMILSLVLGWTIFQWAKETSPLRGLLALFLYVFDSNILAHSHYITNDIGVTLFYFLAIFYFKKYTVNPQPKFLFLLSLFFALAQLSKFSAILLLPTILLLGLITKISARQFAKIIIFCFLFTFIFVLSFYFFNPSSFVEGWQSFKDHVQHGHPAYLLGESSRLGWWYYFPLAFLFKTSPVILILLVVTFLASLRRLPKFILIPIVVYSGASLFSNINLGIRHLLPVLPFIYVFIAQYLRKIRPAAILLFFYLLETILIYPNFLGYFSPIFGGIKQGHLYLLDSNLDWGQDLLKLKKYITANNIKEKIHLAYFGQTVVDEQYLPYSGEYVHGYVAVSAQLLYEPIYYQKYLWLTSLTLLEKFGSSIYLYKLP